MIEKIKGAVVSAEQTYKALYAAKQTIFQLAKIDRKKLCSSTNNVNYLEYKKKEN